MGITVLELNLCRNYGDGKRLMKMIFLTKKKLLYKKNYRKVQVRVRSPKYQGACGSARGNFFEVRECVRHTVKYIAAQRLPHSTQIYLVMFFSRHLTQAVT